MSTQLCNDGDKYLSKWDEAISRAKVRIRQIKRTIHLFESLKAQGMEFPEAEGESKPQKTA